MLLELDTKGQIAMETRWGKITSKRQLTIPKDFYDKLNLGENVEIILEKDGLKIRKLKRTIDDDFSDLILRDLINEGFEGVELLQEFRIRKSLLPLAVENMISDIIEQARQDNRTSEQLDKELFGED